MKDHNDFKDFNPFYNELKSWRDEGELRAEYFDEYKALGLKEVIDTFDILKAQKHQKDTEESRERDRRLDALRLLVSMRLELFTEDRAKYFHYIVEDTIWHHVCKLREEVKDLTHRFKNHRHDKDKNYSEKPVW